MKAVILAGGKGTRLQPFTTSFPKPLMPLGDLPILEILLRQLRAHAVTEVTLLVGHLAYLIEGYFRDGSDLDLRIDYVREERPLGTAGPLRQLRGRVDADTLVMNGDLLTDVDFGALMLAHRQSRAAVTISTYRRNERLELGVLTYEGGDDIVRYDEKPTLELDISMGLYAVRPDVLDRIPDGSYDMPALITDLIAAGWPVAGRRHPGFWLDIGRVDDYTRASEIFANDPDAFLPLTRRDGAGRTR